MLRNALIGAGLSLCLGACASAPPSSDLTKTAASAAVKPEAGCVADTGSRIVPTECAAAGRTYNQTAIKTTGATDVQQALRMLDSSVTLPGR